MGNSYTSKNPCSVWLVKGVGETPTADCITDILDGEGIYVSGTRQVKVISLLPPRDGNIGGVKRKDVPDNAVEIDDNGEIFVAKSGIDFPITLEQGGTGQTNKEDALLALLPDTLDQEGKVLSVYKKEDGGCEAFFVPCNCCDDTPPECCDKMYNVCIAGTSHILGTGEAYRTCWPTCCLTPEGLESGDTDSTYEICGYISCDEGTDESTFHWTFGHTGTLHLTKGELGLGQLCVTGSISTSIQPLDAAYPLSCDYSSSVGNTISVRVTEEAEGCEGCGSCCDKRLWFCINGDSVELPLYGGSHEFDVTDCCPSEFLAFHGITLVQIVIQTGCNPHIDVAGFVAILRLWKGSSRYGPDQCIEGGIAGDCTFLGEALTPFCQGSERLYFQLISPCPWAIWGECCDVGVHVSEEQYLCTGCTGDSTTEECCTKFLWLCINGNSQQLSVNGGSYDFDVSACCGDCTTAELRIANTCNSESANPLSMNWSYWCDGVQVDAGAINISEFCTSNDPVIYNFDTLPCFLQMQVSINNAGCGACTSSDPCADPADCVETDCCVDATPKVLTLTIVGGAYAGVYGMTYDGVSEWINDTGAFSARMSCSVTEWQMSFELDTYTATGCVPLSLDVSSTSYGITSLVVS